MTVSPFIEKDKSNSQMVQLTNRTLKISKWQLNRNAKSDVNGHLKNGGSSIYIYILLKNTVKTR
jgi:hypothetical protein